MIVFRLFWTFFKIGAFTFGGGYAMIPLIQAAIESNGWLSSEELINFIAVSESTPGPFAVNIATYIGSETVGFWGSVMATLGVVLPSFIIILIVAHCYDKFKESRIVRGCMSGLKPAVIGMIGSAVVSVGKTVFFPNGFATTVFAEPSFYVSAVIACGALFLSFKKVHPIIIICASAACGLIAGYLLF